VQRGALTVGGRKGPNRLRFTGRLANGRKLPAGSYNLTLDGQDAAGNGASVRRASFMLVASPGR